MMRTHIIPYVILVQEKNVDIMMVAKKSHSGDVLYQDKVAIIKMRLGLITISIIRHVDKMVKP